MDVDDSDDAVSQGLPTCLSQFWDQIVHTQYLTQSWELHKNQKSYCWNVQCLCCLRSAWHRPKLGKQQYNSSLARTVKRIVDNPEAPRRCGDIRRCEHAGGPFLAAVSFVWRFMWWCGAASYWLQRETVWSHVITRSNVGEELSDVASCDHIDHETCWS